MIEVIRQNAWLVWTVIFLGYVTYRIGSIVLSAFRERDALAQLLRQHGSEIDRLVTERDALTEVLGQYRDIKEELEAAEQASKTRDALKAEYELQKKRADELFSSIDGIIGERDGWIKLYHSMSASNSVAQGMMMREISRIAQIYARDTGKEMKLDPSLADVHSSWASEYVKG